MADITVTLEESPIEIVVDGDKSGEGEGKNTEPVLQSSDGGKTQPTIEESVEGLRAQVEESRRLAAQRRAEGERQIQAAFAAKDRAEKELVSTQKGAVETTIDRLKADKETAKRDYKAAMEKGDYDAASDAHDRIATVAARLVEAEKAQISLAEAEKAPPQRMQPAPAQQGERITQIEHMARSAEAAGDDVSARWLRAHPEYEGRDRELGAAHSYAIARGETAGTEKYIQLVEQALGIDPNSGGRQVETRDDPPARRQQQHRGPVPAPVRRDAVTTTTGRKAPTTIRLSESEQQAAIEVMGPLYPNASTNELLKLYAQQKAGLIEDGNPNYDGA